MVHESGRRLDIILMTFNNNMKKNIFINRSLALLLWRKSPQNNDEVSMYCGIIRAKDGKIVFEKWEKNLDFIIQNEWLNRIKKIPENLKKDIGNCDYQLSLSVSEYDNKNSYIKTGLKWLD